MNNSEKIKKILNKNEFWIPCLHLQLHNNYLMLNVLSSLVMIIPLLIAVTRP